MTLYLLPNALHADSPPSTWCPEGLKQIINTLTGIIGESEKPMRAYLKLCGLEKPVATVSQRLLNEHTTSQEIDLLVLEILKGGIWGYVADAGLPCIADPGAQLVRKARSAGCSIKSFPGASSITQALILAGCSGQKFTFHGYPPKDSKEFGIFIKKIEQQLAEDKQATHLFIERPYVNIRCVEQVRSVAKPSTWLTVVLDIGTPQEEVIHLPVSQWKNRELQSLKDRPAVFVLS